MVSSPQNQAPLKVDLTLYYTQEAQVQPMIPTFAPAAGVATKDGENVKRTELKVPKSRMTKLDYSKLIAGGGGGGTGSNSSGPSLDAANLAAQGASSPDAPVSPTLGSPGTGRRATVHTGSRKRDGGVGSVDTIAATPPPPHLSLGANVQTQQQQQQRPGTADSMLEPPSRLLTPQPTAARPKHIRHQSPSRDNSKRGDSAARNAAARSASTDLMSSKARNVERQAKLLRSAMHVNAAREMEDETARDFINSLEMGDFEALTAGDIGGYHNTNHVDHDTVDHNDIF